jgi:hypothetical protein
VSFGTSAEEVKKVYPKLENLGENQSLGAPAVGGPHITNYALRNQTIEGHQKPVQVEMRFWKGKFWLYIVYFDKTDLDGMLAHFTAVYGEPNSATAKFPLWNFDKSTILVDAKQYRYTINDNELSKEARTWFVEALKQTHPDKSFEVVEGKAKTPSPAPAQTPSPAAAQP